MKTTNKHYKIFVKECKKWQKKLGLTNYQAYYDHDEMEDGVLARVVYCPLANYAYEITLNKTWLREPTTKLLKTSAFHEVCHMLLHRLKVCGESRYITESEIDEAEHEIVRRLENLMFEE